MLLLPVLLGAQDQKVQAKLITKGLPHKLVYSTLKDSRGLLWCATEQGVGLLNGTAFCKIVHNPHDANTIPASIQFSIAEDKDGRIWVASYKNGLSIINIETNKIQLVSPEYLKEKLKTSNINSIKSYSDTEMLIYGPEGAFLINTRTKKIRPLYKNVEIIDALLSKDQLLLLTKECQVIILRDEQLVGQIRKPQHASESTALGTVKGKLFLCSQNGLFQLSSDSVFNKIQIQVNKKNISNDYIGNIYEDKHGAVYLSNNLYGLLKVLRIEDGKFICAKIGTSDWYKEGNTIYSSYYDRKADKFYAGTQGGIYRLARKGSIFNEIINKKFGTVKAILPIGTKELLVGTEKGIHRMLENGTFVKHKEMNKRASYHFIHSFAEHHNHHFALGNSLFKLSGTNTYEQPMDQNELKSAEGEVRGVRTFSGDLFIYGGVSKKVVVLKNGNVYKRYNCKINENVWPPIVQKSENKFLLPSHTGLYESNIATTKTKRIDLGLDVRVCDLAVKNKQIYVATGSYGLWVLDNQYKKIDSLDLTTIGLQNQINSIIIKDSMVWFANSKGLGYANMNTKKITFLESGHAFETSNFTYAAKYDAGDSIYFGGENGIVVIDTKKMNKLKRDFSTFILFPAVYRNDKRYSLTSNQEQHLKHDENNLEYQIVHTNYTYPSLAKFQYRLKRDMPWRLADQSGLLKLYNLPPDHYKIEVRDMNTGNIVKARSFTIHPPWYKTWAFIIAVGLLIIANIIFMTRLYYRKRNIALQKEIEKQNALQSERDRISGDMHDVLGSGLSTIRMIGEMLQSKYPDEKEVQQELEEIIEQTDELNLSMREIVWSLNPKEDMLANFLVYIRVYLHKFYGPSNIHLDVQFPKEFTDVSMKGALRRNLLLCIKEMNTNIVKHAQATSVLAMITIDKDSKMLNMIIEDNGKGLPADLKESNGFTNMRARIENGNGKIYWQNMKPGTRVKFSIPIV